MEVAKQRLRNNSTLSERTELSVNDIMLTLKLCLDATNLTFRGQFYREIYGTAMGSRVSVIAANKVKEKIEERALTTFSHPTQF